MKSTPSQAHLCQQLQLVLKKRRVSVQLDALNRLADFYVKNVENESLSAFASKISEFLSRCGSRNTIVSLQVAERIIEDILKVLNRKQSHPTRIIDSFREVPILSLGSESSTIYLKESTGLKVLDTPENMLEQYKIRYRLLLSRALESKKATSLGQGERLAIFHKELSSSLTPIQNLSSTDRLTANLFGILGKFEGNKYFIEDETGYIQLDLSEACSSDRIYTQGCIVLVRGEWNGQLFRVTNIEMPPLDASLSNIMEPKALCQVIDSEVDVHEKQQNHIMVIISEIWLDHDSVFNKLEKLFSSLQADDVCPDTVVLMGNFLSPSLNPDEDHLLHFNNGFQQLASLLHEYIPNEQCQVVIIPGPNDPGIKNILPRPPILESLLNPLRHLYKCSTAASNPVRIVCQNSNIIFYRDNIEKKLVPHSIFLLPNNLNRLREMIVQTLLDQGHLCPLPMDMQPVFWNHEQSLWLFPPPQFLVLGCGLESFQYTYGQTKCFGTGSFALEGFFLVYESKNQHIQICQI
ncbi:DNA polymerase epsilon subunit 2 [Galdieria sulphuraria]|nr:DNA polymerase epsilon subunit 2 [Galdieria sulphuraria]